MHEQTIAAKIIADAKEHGKVKSITIEVGDLAHLPADEMKDVLEKLTDWQINIVRREAVINCSCGYMGEPEILQQLHDNNIYECPECHKKMPQILEGHHIILREVEVEEDETEEETEDISSEKEEI
jgi:Zn finger protein HypA/HybF involved in hydrogenase expression